MIVVHMTLPSGPHLLPWSHTTLVKSLVDLMLRWPGMNFPQLTPLFLCFALFFLEVILASVFHGLFFLPNIYVFILYFPCFAVSLAFPYEFKFLTLTSFPGSSVMLTELTPEGGLPNTPCFVQFLSSTDAPEPCEVVVPWGGSLRPPPSQGPLRCECSDAG